MGIRFIYVLVALVAVAALFLSVWLFRRNRLSTRVFMMWLVVWLAMGVFAAFPSLLDYLMRLVSMRDRLVFLFMSSIIVLFALVFYLSAVIANTSRRLDKLTQQIALLIYRLKEGENQQTGLPCRAPAGKVETGKGDE